MKKDTNYKVKSMVLKSILDGILRGIIIWCTTIILTSDAIAIDFLKTALFVIAGIVISGISMTYLYLINKESLHYLIISNIISMLFGVTSFIIALIYMSKPFWDFVSNFLKLSEIGTAGGILIMYYQAAFIVLTWFFRILFLVIYVIKYLIGRKKYDCTV